MYFIIELLSLILFSNYIIFKLISNKSPGIQIKRLSNSIEVYYGGKNEFFQYDKVVIATHADEALGLIDDPLENEKQILSNFSSC